MLHDVPSIVSEEPITPRTSLDNSAEPSTLDVNQNEQQLIIRALKESNNNKTAAAKKLGISRRTLHRRITELGL